MDLYILSIILQEIHYNGDVRNAEQHDIIVKPDSLEVIHTTHTHGPDLPRIEMLKGYSEIKRQAKDSEIGTRSILATVFRCFTHPPLLNFQNSTP